MPNAHFYEIQPHLNSSNPDPIPGTASLSSVFANRSATFLFQNQPIGSHLCVRVRAIGSKGPSPWTAVMSIRVK